MNHPPLPHLAAALAFLGLAACSNDGGTGGQTGSGGLVRTGGVTGSGGQTSTGGAPARGGATGTGGGAGSGGTSASGGSTGSGGANSGGTPASGGRTGTGGRTATGGVTGGATGSGGQAGSGGTTSSGGTANTGGASGTDGPAGTGGAPHTGRWQIMLLGDSITETTCYPKLLSQKLIGGGQTNFDFVGSSLNNQSCGSAANVQTEGHGCYLVTNLVKDVATVTGCNGTKGSLAELNSWAAEQPEVVLMEYGTNDAWSSIATQTILDAYGLVVDEFRKQNPSVIFFVAQITPLNPSGCGSCEANVEALNAKIPAWARGKSTSASPIHVVNVWAALPAATYTPNSTYTSDGCHPNPAGSQLLADAWYAGLVAEGIP